MPDKIVTLAMFHDPMAAEMTRNRLAAEGIPVMISGDNAGTLFGGTLAMVQLQVAEPDLPRAVHLLEAMEESLEDEVEEANLPLRESSGNEGIQRERPFKGLPKGSLAETSIAPMRLPREDIPDSDDETPLISGPDEIANRAWRAAIIGFFVLPAILHFYSLTLLWCVASGKEEPSPSGTRTMYGALVLDLLGFSWAGIALQFVLHRPW